MAILAGLLLLIYPIPMGVATLRQHRNAGAIVALNLLLGWTFLGWVGALVWALTDNCKRTPAGALPLARPKVPCRNCRQPIAADAERCPTCQALQGEAFTSR